jgi:uncharacterized protein (DUF1697 family)
MAAYVALIRGIVRTLLNSGNVVFDAPKASSAKLGAAIEKGITTKFDFTAPVAYLWCKAGAIDSKLSQAFGRKAGGTVTLRNWATVLKMAALAADGE